MKTNDAEQLAARRRDLVAAMEEITAAGRDLTGLFDDLELVLRDAVGQIERGARALDVAQSMRLADRRESLNAAADRVRRGRHATQLAMFLLAVDEGESRAEIARVWRVSRQLISRMIRQGPAL
jgi:ABC-type transporter Mla subunit MlaD